MRLFTRQRRELKDDCCDILLSYYDNWCAAIFARVVAQVAYYIMNTTKCAIAVCYSTRASDADDVRRQFRRIIITTYYIHMRLFTRQRRELNDNARGSTSRILYYQYDEVCNCCMLQHACAECRRPVITRRLLTPCLWPISGDSGQWDFKTRHCPVASRGIQMSSGASHAQSRPVTPSHAQWQQV